MNAKELAKKIYFQGKWSGTNQNPKTWSVHWLESLLNDALSLKSLQTSADWNKLYERHIKQARLSQIQKDAEIGKDFCLQYVEDFGTCGECVSCLYANAIRAQLDVTVTDERKQG